MKKERNSSLELLKILGLLAIIYCHARPESSFEPVGHINMSLVTDNWQRFIGILSKYVGQTGNDIFIISSAWFLLDSKRMNPKKVLTIIADCFVISVMFLGAFLLAGYEFPFKIIVRQIFPIWFNNNWFVGCYILLYLIHPFLNVIIEKMERRTLLITNLGMLGLYSGLCILYEGFFYSRIIGLITIYFFTAYVKKYMQEFCKSRKANMTALVFATVAGTLLVLITNILGLHMDFFANKALKWFSFMNPLNILAGMALVNLFMSIHFVNKTVNYLSSITLLVYIIHYNYLVVHYLTGDIFKWIYTNYSYDYEIVWTFLYTIVLVVGSTTIATVYNKTLQKLVYKVCDGVYNVLGKVGNSFVEYLMKFN